MGRRNREPRRKISRQSADEEKERHLETRMEDDEEEQTPRDDEVYQSDDSYTYSDDSASLSDAYFFPRPGDGLARPPRYQPRENDPLEAKQTNPRAPYAPYGSILRKHEASSPQPLPLWVSGAIQEGKEHEMAVPPISYQDANQSSSDVQFGRRKGDRKRQRRHQRMKMKQFQASARERRVMQIKGRPQPLTAWRDPLFAVLFVVQILVVTGGAVFFASEWLKLPQLHGLGRGTSAKSTRIVASPNSIPSLVQDGGARLLGLLKPNITDGDIQYTDDDHILPTAMTPRTQPRMSTVDLNDRSVVMFVSLIGLYSCLVAYVSFGFMLVLGRALIPVMLIVSVLLTLAWGLVGMTLDPYGLISIMGFAALLTTLAYTIYNWHRIPFAATNLYTAICAVRYTMDIAIIGMTSLLVALFWCVVWCITFVGICNNAIRAAVDCTQNTDCRIIGGDNVAEVVLSNVPLLLMMMMSFCWTHAVIRNVVRSTVAGAVGTWWYYPRELTTCCTPSVFRPLLRSLSHSFGSICLGSWIIPVAHLLSFVGSLLCCFAGSSDAVYRALQKDELNIRKDAAVVEGDSAADSVRLGARLHGLTKRFGDTLRSYNMWSYTYIGMYGYSLQEAGSRALELFETREWLDVVSDSLIQNVLLMACVIMGGSTGIVAVFLVKTNGLHFPSFHIPTYLAFVVGSFLGFTLSDILLMGVVGSAVDTVLVCFAAGPFEFDKNHPRLSREMREVWSQQVWSPDT